MSKHRVDVDLKGMSHYVNDQLVDSTGFPLWEHQLPDGLRLGGGRPERPAKKDLKFVRKKGVGRSIEWTSNRVRLYTRIISLQIPDREPIGCSFCSRGSRAGRTAASTTAKRAGRPAERAETTGTRRLSRR